MLKAALVVTHDCQRCAFPKNSRINLPDIGIGIAVPWAEHVVFI